MAHLGVWKLFDSPVHKKGRNLVEMPTENDVFMVLVVGLHSLRTHVFCRQLISYSENIPGG